MRISLQSRLQEWLLQIIILVNKVLALCKLIDSQPTAFDIDKVVEHLESEFNNIPFQYEVNYEDGFSDGLLEAIKTVKAGGIDGN